MFVTSAFLMSVVAGPLYEDHFHNLSMTRYEADPVHHFQML
ncbi:hypothetical protein Mal48_05270 [Thalassoglobus polymorphus]|uniref:Uncharacterized protein n=1 Tax=Thalassoglobus polymorphus TaxID=2527994 RepID=A0A517QI71_9PLAN|nr:hypothetical protein Mal48_05270 [Thalassoglobus polymorphus]